MTVATGPAEPAPRQSQETRGKPDINIAAAATDAARATLGHSGRRAAMVTAGGNGELGDFPARACGRGNGPGAFIGDIIAVRFVRQICRFNIRITTGRSPASTSRSETSLVMVPERLTAQRSHEIGVICKALVGPPRRAGKTSVAGPVPGPPARLERAGAGQRMVTMETASRRKSP